VGSLTAHALARVGATYCCTQRLASSTPPVGRGRWGNWSRKLELPTKVYSASIAAQFDNGVLTLRVPKAAKAKPVRIPVGPTS